MTALLGNIGRWFSSYSLLDRTILAFCFLVFTVAFDYNTGMVPVLILYVLCVVWCSNYLGGRFATGFALLAAYFRVGSPEFALKEFQPLLYLNIAATYIIIDAAIQFKNQLLEQLHQLLTRVELQSLTDPLTGAANRRAFIARLEAALVHTHRYGEPFSVAYIDVDNFKTLNDTAGHAAGDRLLCRIVQTVQATLRGDDMVARLGGDEFGVIFSHAPQILGRHVQRVKSALDDELQEDAAFRVVSFSIGIVHYDGTRRATCDELIQFADRLMYEIKGNGKNGVRIDAFSFEALPGHANEK